MVNSSDASRGNLICHPGHTILQPIWFQLKKRRMPAFTVKAIPDDLYDRLKESARLHHRSVNREILFRLETSLRSEKVPASEILAAAKQIHAAMGDRILTLAEIESARREGRT